MKKFTTLSVGLLLAFFQMLPASAQSEVHLTFLRSGANASDVTVYVKDASGNTISGASATLEKVEKGSGNNVFTGLTTTTLQTGNNMGTDTNTLCAIYNNAQYDFTQFTFKLSGLDDYAYQNAEMKVAAINNAGQYQMKMDRTFNFQVWNVSDINANNALYTLENQNVTDGGATNQQGVDNTKTYTLSSSTTHFTTSADQYLIVRFTRTDVNGCFVGIRELTLKQKSYTVTPTATNNLGNVATFSASDNVKFDANTTAYIATENGENSVTLSKLQGDVLAAKKGAILISTETTITATPTSATSTDTRDNFLVGGGDETLALTAGNYYILNKSDNDAVFSPLGSTGSTTLAANKAALSTGSTNSNALSIHFDETTGIQNAATNNAIANSRIYNLQGQAVKGALSKGIYLQGGKKIIVK